MKSKGTTKAPGKFWKELKLDEAGLELWERKDGVQVPVRVTHVLVGKVTSRENYERGIFLFNTWQQYGDGRKRTRNGLLSEKLCASEMPIEKNLHDVCRRAVTEEEMQRVTESTVMVKPGVSAPTYRAEDQCPLEVVEEYFVDHTIEVEESKSYPGLLTMYHLYTVDIICTGCPPVDFNTLEFEEGPDGKKEKLKYVHAWVWLEWSNIQRYLFEGSELKETKTRGSFNDAEDLEEWLSRFDLDLENWGQGGAKKVKDLYQELDQHEANLELWGRHDGVPLLVRVIHVLRGKVCSSNPQLHGKFLFNTWQQFNDGRMRQRDVLLAKKLKTSDVPFDEVKFRKAGEQAVSEVLCRSVDSRFELNPQDPPKYDEQEASPVKVLSVDFVERSCDLESSPSFPGLLTTYHLYTVEIACDGLPSADFATLEFKQVKDHAWSLRQVFGWRWITWPQIIDALHGRIKGLERTDEAESKAHRAQTLVTNEMEEVLEKLQASLAGVQAKLSPDDSDIDEAGQACDELERLIQQAKGTLEDLQKDRTRVAQASAGALPPSMVSKLAEKSIVTSDFLESAEQAMIKEEAMKQQIRRASKLIQQGGMEGASVALMIPESSVGSLKTQLEVTPKAAVKQPTMATAMLPGQGVDAAVLISREATLVRREAELAKREAEMAKRETEEIMRRSKTIQEQQAPATGGLSRTEISFSGSGGEPPKVLIKLPELCGQPPHISVEGVKAQTASSSPTAPQQPSGVLATLASSPNGEAQAGDGAPPPDLPAAPTYGQGQLAGRRRPRSAQPSRGFAASGRGGNPLPSAMPHWSAQEAYTHYMMAGLRGEMAAETDGFQRPWSGGKMSYHNDADVWSAGPPRPPEAQRKAVEQSSPRKMYPRYFRGAG